MFGVDLEGIAGVVAIQSKGRHQQRPSDADGVHRDHHVIAGDLRRPRQEAAPRTLRPIPLVGMDLGVNRGSLRGHRTCSFPRFSEYRKSRAEARLSIPSQSGLIPTKVRRLSQDFRQFNVFKGLTSLWECKKLSAFGLIVGSSEILCVIDNSRFSGKAMRVPVPMLE